MEPSPIFELGLKVFEFEFFIIEMGLKDLEIKRTRL
jgi:hypothetical protein